MAFGGKLPWAGDYLGFGSGQGEITLPPEIVPSEELVQMVQ